MGIMSVSGADIMVVVALAAAGVLAVIRGRSPRISWHPPAVTEVVGWHGAEPVLLFAA